MNWLSLPLEPFWCQFGVLDKYGSKSTYKMVTPSASGLIFNGAWCHNPRPKNHPVWDLKRESSIQFFEANPTQQYPLFKACMCLIPWIHTDHTTYTQTTNTHSLTLTVVRLSNVKDLICPFSRNTFRTLGMSSKESSFSIVCGKEKDRKTTTSWVDTVLCVLCNL